MKAKFKILCMLFAVAALGLFFAHEAVAATASKPRSGVASFIPTGKVADNVAFKVVFTEALVSRDDIGKAFPVEEFPFTVTPAIQAEGKWLDNKTFVASLLAPLDMGTVYSAKIRDDLKTLKNKSLGSGREYSFQTAPLSLLAVNSVGIRESQAGLELEFNAPVSPSRLRGYLSIVYADGTKIDYNFYNHYPAKKIRVGVYVGTPTSPFTLNVNVAAGLTGEAGSLGLAKNEARTLEFKPSLILNAMTAQEESIRVESNFAVNLEAAKDFVEITPEVPFSLEHYYGGVFLIRGEFKPRERFTVTFKKGLPAQDNALILQETQTRSIIMPDLSPSINFMATGTYLSPIDGGKVPVELVNVNKAQLNVWRLYENNISVMMRGDYPYFQRDLARRVYSKEIMISSSPNEKSRRAIALDEILSGDRGLFQLTLTNPAYEYWYERTQVVNLSDMGMVARLWEDGALFWVNTLSGLKPIEGAQVRLYSAGNQLLSEGTTDAEGLWLLQRTEPWSSEESMVPALATVSKGQDVTFVRLTRGLFTQEIFDTSGRPWLRSGYDAALFSPRDIYRTGEQATFKALVRTHDLKIPEPFPVLFVIKDPLGRTVRRGTALLGEEGGALFTLDLPGNALTGHWQVELYIPGDESRSLALMNFNVEDFAPPRIEVKLGLEAKFLEPGAEVDLDISGKYLFGVDGAGLTWEALWRAREGRFVPTNDKWKGFTFGDAARSFSPEEGSIGTGELDESGEARASFSFSDEWEAPSVIDVSIVARVMEEGGRWVSDSTSLQYFPSPWLLGITSPEGILGVGNDLVFRVAAITPDESPADPGELTATLYRVSWNYNLVEIDGYMRWQSSESFDQQESKTFTLKEGMGEVTFKPSRWGTYLLRVTDQEDNARASIRFYADDPEYADRGGSQLLDRVEVELDKDIYKVGDTAKVTLRAPFEGLLLFNVEAEGLIDRKVLKVEGAETVIEVPVTEKMIPNAWCTAWLIRPLGNDENWTTHRAIGIKRLKVELEQYTLNVTLEAPEKIEPAVKLPVKVTLTGANGEPAKGEFALAFVDDGVLGLTGYKTPDLLNHFLGLRELNSNGYDIYDLLMPIESRATELLHPSGDGAMATFAGASKAQRFKILSLFEGGVAVGETGSVELELDLPEFSGRGRLFAVATSGNRFGSAEKKVQIARDIITEADLPRFAAPGDRFTVPVTLFNSSEESRDVTVDLSALGELAIGQPKLTASVPAKGSYKWDVALTAKNPGTATYIVKTSWEQDGAEKSFEQRIDLPIRSPFPIVTLLGSNFFESGDTQIEIERGLFTGPALGKLTLADTPLVDLTQATSFLMRYPYGCLEQTLSSAWPFLILPEALSQIDPLLVDINSVRQKTDHALNRLGSMQLYDGSFGRWPGDSFPYNWGSVYATHFLVEAKKAGVDYPEEMLKMSLNWIRQFLASIPANNYPWQEKDDLTSKAYAAYVLALHGEKPLGWMHYLKENQHNMWPSGRVWLAGSYALTQGKADALRELGTWGGNDSIAPEALYETLDSNVRNTAQLLSFWTEVEPRSTEAMQLVKMLLAWGRQNRWYSTQENAAVAMALGRYLIKTGYEKNTLEGALKDDSGKELLTFKSGEKSFIGVDELSEDRLLLSVTGGGSGYYSWNITGSPMAAPKPEQSGITLAYLWTDRDGNKLSFEEPFEQGQEILVTLLLEPSVSVSNLVVSYLLPAGMEIENPRLMGNEERETPGVRYDVRDDRLLLFIDRLTERTEYLFVMRAVTRGNFALPPVAAEGMYDPSVRFIGKQEKNITVK